MPSPGPNRNSRRCGPASSTRPRRWNRYKPAYERYLWPQPLTEEDEFLLGDDSPQAELPSTGVAQTNPESESASEPASEQRPTEPDEPLVPDEPAAPEVAEAIGEAQVEGSEEASS